MSTTRRTAGVHSRKRPLGPNGERICYNCAGPLPKGMRYNCSPKCSDEWMCKTSPNHLRYVLFQRDHGICAICGSDTLAVKKEYAVFCGELKRSWISQFDEMYSPRPWEERHAWLAAHGIPSARSCSDWWDADHIVPVIEGGGECGISNFRTLCIPCHRKETAALRKRMAMDRRGRKVLPLFASDSK